MLSKPCFVLQQKTAGQTATVKYNCATHVIGVGPDSYYVWLCHWVRVNPVQSTEPLLYRLKEQWHKNLQRTKKKKTAVCKRNVCTSIQDNITPSLQTRMRTTTTTRTIQGLLPAISVTRCPTWCMAAQHFYSSSPQPTYWDNIPHLDWFKLTKFNTRVSQETWLPKTWAVYGWINRKSQR